MVSRQTRSRWEKILELLDPVERKALLEALEWSRRAEEERAAELARDLEAGSYTVSSRALADAILFKDLALLDPDGSDEDQG